MKVSLWNFGAGIRAIPDYQNNNISIPVGAIVHADIPQAAVDFIRNAMARGDTLIIVPDQLRLAPEFVELAYLLQNINTDDYDALLMRTAALLGVRRNDAPRPTRGQLRDTLKSAAISYAHRLQASKHFIKEEGDPKELQKEAEKPPAKQPENTPPPSPREKSETDDALRAALGMPSSDAQPPAPPAAETPSSAPASQKRERATAAPKSSGRPTVKRKPAAKAPAKPAAKPRARVRA